MHDKIIDSHFGNSLQVVFQRICQQIRRRVDEHPDRQKRVCLYFACPGESWNPAVCAEICQQFVIWIEISCDELTVSSMKALQCDGNINELIPWWTVADLSGTRVRESTEPTNL